MAKIDRIPALLETLVITPNISHAARLCGISQPTIYKWLVRSRTGDADLQEIPFMGVVAPFHVHWDNCTRLTASAIEKAALHAALNGTDVPAFRDGKPVWQEDEKLSIYTDQQIREMYEIGAVDWPDRILRDENGKRVQQTVWLKPPEQLRIKLLESLFSKRYGPRQTIDVNYAHSLTLPRPDEQQEVKAIEHQPQIAFEDETEQPEKQGLDIAAGRPATSSDEFDRWNKSGEFEHASVEVDMGDGQTTKVSAGLDPMTVQPGDSPLVRDLKERAKQKPQHPVPDRPVFVGKPEDEPTTEPKPPQQPQPLRQPQQRQPIRAVPMPAGKQIPAARPGDGEYIGHGPDPTNVGGARGFKVSEGPIFSERGKPLNLSRRTIGTYK